MKFFGFFRNSRKLSREKQEVKKLKSIQKIIKYDFNDESLLYTALSHPSFANERGKKFDNQRMEFLGDSVLGLAITEILYQKFPSKAEGDLSKIKSSLVCKKMLARLAREIKLNKNLLLGTGERNSGGNERDSNLEDAFEALIGAVYLDSDFETTRKVLRKFFVAPIKNVTVGGRHENFKSKLQEESQELFKTIPKYKVLKAVGPEHKKIFTVEVNIANKYKAIGTGKSKKEAEQDAAKTVIEQFKSV